MKKLLIASLLALFACATYAQAPQKTGVLREAVQVLGGNDWVYYNAQTAPLWGRIVALMGSYGFDVLPYYELQWKQRQARPRAAAARQAADPR